MLSSSFELSAAGLQLATCAHAGQDPAPGLGPPGVSTSVLYPVQVAARLRASKLPADPLLPALQVTLTLGALEAHLSPEQLSAMRAALEQLQAAAAAATSASGPNPNPNPITGRILVAPSTVDGDHDTDSDGESDGGGDGWSAGSATDPQRQIEEGGEEGDLKSPEPAPRLELQATSGFLRVRSPP